MPRTGGRQRGTLNKKTVERLNAENGASIGLLRESIDFLPSEKTRAPAHARRERPVSESSPAFPAYRLERTDKLVPYANNARTHSPAQIDKLAKLITEFGWTNPVLVDGKRGIIAGHGRVLAAKKLGIDAVPVIELSHLSAAQKRAYVIADNRSALDAGWNDELLALELGELRDGGFDLALTGFDGHELDALFGGADGLTDPDDAPEVQADPVTVLGDVWLLGRHRLVCGDCADADVIGLVLAGNAAGLIVTSPPYNQKIDTFKPSGMHKEHGWVKKVGALAYKDDLPEPEYQDQQRALLEIWHGVLRDGGSLFYNHKNRYREKRVVSPMAWLPGPFAFRQEVIWSRPGSVTQNARMFLPFDERIFWLYKGTDFTFNDEVEIKSWSSVWDIAPKANLDHAVAFPVELPTRCIRASSKPDDIVLDPFAGSGTTIIAAEMTGRACIGMEIAPAYVDVAVRRWEAFTGLQATLEANARTFAAISLERLPAAAQAAE